MRIAGVYVAILGVVLFVAANRSKSGTTKMRIGAIAAMIAGTILATWEWCYELARRDGFANRISGILVGISFAVLGTIFLYDTRLASTPKARRQRTRAKLMILLGILVIILDLLR